MGVGEKPVAFVISLQHGISCIPNLIILYRGPQGPRFFYRLISHLKEQGEKIVQI
jgi:hypothetical protein